MRLRPYSFTGDGSLHISILQFIRDRKRNSSLRIFDGHANLKSKWGNRHFRCRGYYADSVEKHENAIKEYIRNPLQEDIAMDTLDGKETKDLFTGKQESIGKKGL